LPDLKLKLILKILCRPNPKKIVSVQRKIEAYLASDHELKETAQRAFHSYLKSIYLLKNKAVFDVFKLDTALFASSLGLAIQPRVRFLEKQIKLKAKKITEGADSEPTTSTNVKESKKSPSKVAPYSNILKIHGESEGKFVFFEISF
jgi:ATP-dependent RNA helicase DDX10/DBP4